MTGNEFGAVVETGTGSGITLDDDGLYRALASTRRRRLLYVLLVEEECSVERLATILTGWDSTETGRMATPEDREEILIDLKHRHLPGLDDAGLITYDHESDRVEIGSLDGSVAQLISRSIEAEK